MTRLRVDRSAVTCSTGRSMVAGTSKCFAVPNCRDCISFTKSVLAFVASFGLLVSPVWAAPSSTLGTVVYADRAHVGVARASVGATVFSGDRISTDPSGSVQVRAASARLLLSGSSSATFSEEGSAPAATLTLGSATFSTANSDAFALHVASAVIRANSNQPTIGQVTVLNPKELVVKSTRGSLSIAVEGDVREIPEGAAYHVVLDPNAAVPQGPRGAGTKGYGGPPIKAAKSKFMWYAIAITGVVTYLAISEVVESPERP